MIYLNAKIITKEIHLELLLYLSYNIHSRAPEQFISGLLPSGNFNDPFNGLELEIVKGKEKKDQSTIISSGKIQSKWKNFISTMKGKVQLFIIFIFGIIRS